MFGFLKLEMIHLSPITSVRSDPGFLGHPDPDPDLGKKFTDPDQDPDPSSTIIFKSQNNGI